MVELGKSGARNLPGAFFVARPLDLKDKSEFQWVSNWQFSR